MTPRRRPFLLCLLLTLSLVAAGGARGLAHATAMPAGGLVELVICTGDGVRTVLVDEDGNNAEPGEHCPELDCAHCVLLTLTAIAPPAGWSPVRRWLRLRCPATADDVARSRPVARARARDPPRLG